MLFQGEVIYAPPISGQNLRGPNWGLFFVLKFVRSRGFGARFSSTVSKVLSDRKGLFKHKNGR